MYNGTNRIVAGTTATSSDYAEYTLQELSFETMQLPSKSYLPWAIYTSEVGSERRTRIEQLIAEYNSAVKEFLNAPGLMDFFRENGLILSRAQIEQGWGEELSDKLFRLNDYFFIQSLRAVGNLIVGTGVPSPEYLMTIPKIGNIRFRITPDGNITYNYPTNEEYVLAWNRSNDERDFTYELWNLLSDYCYDSSDAASYECWDQGRDDLDHPDERWSQCLRYLEQLGFIDTYSVNPQIPCPAWFNAEKTSGSFDFMVLDKRFLKNEEAMAEVTKILHTTGYHVIIEVCPDDCMGMRAYDAVFSTLEDAMAFFKNPFGSGKNLRDELIDLYGFAGSDNDIYEDEDEVDGEDEGEDEDDVEENVVLHVAGEIVLLIFDHELRFVDGVRGLDGEIETGCWMNTYDGIDYEYERIASLIDLYCKLGAHIVCRRDVDFLFTNDDIY